MYLGAEISTSSSIGVRISISIHLFSKIYLLTYSLIYVYLFIHLLLFLSIQSLNLYFNKIFINLKTFRYDEIEYYDWNNPGSTTVVGKAIGHFTQVSL